MNTVEKTYTGIVLSIGVLFVLFLLVLGTMVYPVTPEKGVIQLAMGIYVIVGSVFFITSACNIKAGRLTTIATTIQIVFLFLSAYAFPIGIWGIFLLRKHLQTSSVPPPLPDL